MFVVNFDLNSLGVKALFVQKLQSDSLPRRRS